MELGFLTLSLGWIIESLSFYPLVDFRLVELGFLTFSRARISESLNFYRLVDFRLMELELLTFSRATISESLNFYPLVDFRLVELLVILRIFKTLYISNYVTLLSGHLVPFATIQINYCPGMS
jgi:hypothetical protein